MQLMRTLSICHWLVVPLLALSVPAWPSPTRAQEPGPLPQAATSATSLPFPAAAPSAAASPATPTDATSAAPVLATVASTGVAPAAAPASPDTPLTAAEIESRRKQAEESAELNEEQKTKVAELYRQALEQFQQAEQLKAQAAEHKAAAENVPQRVADLRAELADLKNRQPKKPADQPLAELEQALSARDLKLKELKAEHAKREAEPAARSTRRKEIRAALVALPQKLDEVRRQLEIAPPADEHALVSLARRTELLARRAALEQELPAREQELAKYDAQEAADFLRVLRDKLAQEVALAEKEFTAWNEFAQRKRDAEASAAVWKAQSEAYRADARLKPYADHNQALAAEAKSVTELIAKTDSDLQAVRTRLEGVQGQFEQARKKVEAVGLTGAIGLMLRKQRMELPNVRRRSQNISARSQFISDAQYAMLDYDEQRTALTPLEPHVQGILDMANRLQQPAGQQFVDASHTVLEHQCEYLDTLIRSYNTYFERLVELDTTERQLIRLTKDYRHYIDERVFWIRSAKPLLAEVRLDQSDVTLASPAQWHSTAATLWQDLRRQPLQYAAVLVLLGGLLFAKRRFREGISEAAAVASRGSCCETLPTVRAGLLTALLVVPWPGLMLFLSWRLTPAATGGDELTRGLAAGLWTAAWAYLAIDFARQLCRPDGLARVHFNWPNSVARDLRRNLRWVMLTVLPLVLLSSTLQAADPEHGQDMLGRIGFLAGAVLMAMFFRRMLSPTAGVLREYVAYHPKGWVDRLKHFWWCAGMAAPLGLAGLSVFGYHYTARHLAFRLFVTLALGLVLLVVQGFLVRLTLIARRKLSIADARRRRAESAESRSAAASDPNQLSPQQLISQAEQTADFHAQSSQIARLIATAMTASLLIGLWMIWTDVVPALGFLDRFELLHTTVTLADLGLALIIAVITVIAARNVPGLLEMAILQRLPLENSVRYAITTLAGYAIILIGVIAGCNVFGLRWSQIQWLATALTFGLAFGLQEMFANFVAGLILLFERPIRVGDVVTVDDTTGVVARIRIRATTIVNWDRKEFIVPNKEFITGKLLNWTLSDQVNRIVINVGVAYGSDTELTTQLLLKVAADHPLTLKDPPSLATFEGFGDSALNFTLRTFLPSMEKRLPVIHELHTAIDRTFRDAGIEIAFPQRDLHVRSLDAVQINLHRETRHRREGKTAA